MRIETSWKYTDDGEYYPGESKSVIVEHSQVNNTVTGEVYLSLYSVSNPSGNGNAFAYLSLEQAKDLRDNLNKIISRLESN